MQPKLWLIVYYLFNGDLAYDFVPPNMCIERGDMNGGVIEYDEADGASGILVFERASCRGPQAFGPPQKTNPPLADIVPQRK